MKPTSGWARLNEQIRAALAADDRPVVGVVGLDPATRGPLGLAVWVVDEAVPADWYTGPAPIAIGGAVTTQWLGGAVARLCAPGERIILAVESNAFGARVGRALGRCYGSVEGLLVDLNALAPTTAVDVAAATWRGDANIGHLRGRATLKRAAVEATAGYTGSPSGMAADAAEACLIARCVVQRIQRIRRGDA